MKHHKALKLFVCEKKFSWKSFSFTQAASNLTKVIWQFSQSLKLCRSLFSLAQIKKCFQMTRTIQEVFIQIWQVAHIEVYQVYDYTRLNRIFVKLYVVYTQFSIKGGMGGISFDFTCAL